MDIATTKAKPSSWVMRALASIPVTKQAASDAKSILLYRYEVLPTQIQGTSKTKIKEALDLTEHRWARATSTLKEWGVLEQKTREFRWDINALIEEGEKQKEKSNEDQPLEGLRTERQKTGLVKFSGQRD